MDIVVSIVEGNIVVEQPGARSRWTFGDQDAAVEMIAEKVDEDAVPVSFHASCEAPGMHGRPEFSRTLFVESLQDAIYEIQAASRPRAA